MSDVYVCSPRTFFDIRCSEIASEAVLQQKQSHSSYMARRVLHGCPRLHLLFQLALNFHERKY